MKRLGFSLHQPQVSIEEGIAQAAKWKLAALEINLNSSAYFPEHLDKTKRTLIQKTAQKAEIELLLHAPDDVNLLSRHKNIRLAGVERLKEMLEFGEEIKAAYFTLHTGKVGLVASGSGRMKILQNPPFKSLAENFRDSTLRLLEFSEGKMELSFENTNHFEGFFEEVIAGLLEKTNLKLTWDIGHTFAETPKKMENTLKFFFSHLSKVKVLHLHDRKGPTDHLPVGAGTIPWARFGEVLQAEPIYKIVEVKDLGGIEASLTHLKNLKFNQTFPASQVSKK